jgi:tetratricopeptide (TPR) repeat protein
MNERSTRGVRPAPRTAFGTRLGAALVRLDAWLEAHAALVGAALYLWALALRLAHLLEFRDSLLARVPLMDAAFYRAEAWHLARGAPAASDAYFMTPLYPLFLSLLFRVLGDGPTGAPAVQLALGALVAPLVFALGRRALRPSMALAAAAGIASFAPLVFFEPLYLVEGLVLLALLSALLLAVRGPQSLRRAALSGAFLGIAILGRGSNLLLALPLLAWFLLGGATGAATPAGPPGHRGLRLAAAFVVGCLVVLAPLLVRNALQARRPLFLTANAGFNLYVGNGPDANGAFVVLPGIDLLADPLTLRYVQRQVHRTVTASEASDFWLERTRAWMREHPRRTARLFARKMLLFWNRLSIPQVEGFDSADRGARLVRFPFWHRFALFPLGLVGTCLVLGGLLVGRLERSRYADVPQVLPERTRVLVLLASVTLVYSISIALFFITDRYRVAVLPWLAILSAHAVAVCGAGLARADSRRLLGLALLLAGGVFVTSPERVRVDRVRMQRDLHVHSALRYAEARRFGEALAEYREAQRLDPYDPDVLDGMARMLGRAGQDSLAMQQYRALLVAQPTYTTGWYNLGNLYRRKGRLGEAAEAYRKALDLDPLRETAWNNMGEVYRAQGDTARAADAYRHAIAIVPGHAQALNNLGALRAQQGDAAAAEAGFRAAVAANPRYVPALANLAKLLGDSRRRPEALELWRRVLVLEPDNVAATNAVRDLGTGPRARLVPLPPQGKTP